MLAISANKDAAGIIAALAPLADRIFLARNDSVRSADPRELQAIAGSEASVFGSVGEAIDAARADAGPADVIVVTGSLFTVADAKRVLADR